MRWDQNEDKQTLEQIRSVRLASEVGQWFNDGPPRHWLHSEYGRALNAISRAALKYAEASRAPVSGGDGSFGGLLEQGINVVNHLWCGVQDEETKLKLWSHRVDPFYDLKNNNTPKFDRPEIESAVGKYLALPYRAEYIDRLFADVLLAMELYQYHDALKAMALTSSPPKHPLVDYLEGLCESFLFWGFLGLIVFMLYRFGWLSDGWAVGGYITCSVLFLIVLTVGTVSLPFAWRAYEKNLTLVNPLLVEMSTCYLELKPNGPVSARRLVERLAVVSDKGAAWPPPLHALLDDVMARTGRL